MFSNKPLKGRGEGETISQHKILTNVGRQDDTMPLLISMMFQAQGRASVNGTSALL